MLEFWGKSSIAFSGERVRHPLLWHSLDVAAVIELLLDLFPNPIGELAANSGSEISQVKALLIRLTLLHDIGKFSIGFQSKAPEFYPQCLGALPANLPLGDHTAIGLRLLLKDFEAEMDVFAPGIDAHAKRPLFEAVCAHHGRPLNHSQWQHAQNLRPAEIGLESLASARQLVALASKLIEGPVFTALLTDEMVKQASWLIAGLVNLADWIGSNEKIFHFEPPGDVETYWCNVARPRAQLALAAAGLAHPAISKATGYLSLTGATHPPSPLQRFAESVEIVDGPNLFLIEDMTGAGKTEAALILAQRLMLGGRGDGLFVALPTMATANAIYGRLGGIYRRLFDAAARPSLVLAHGARSLHEGFRDSIVEIGDPGDEPYGKGGDDCQPASASCAAWIADDRRKAFFADVGAGTIDQAFLAVLPSKFAALRQLGLSRRVLIIDEAHAYGAYESVELARLLTFHSAHGGSAIVLSATLPETVKAALAKAFRIGLRQPFKQGNWPQAYPSVTQIGAQGDPIFKEVKPRPDLPRCTPVERLADADSALDALAAAARTGACCAYIRNTVDDVLQAGEALRARGIEPLIFHARFAMSDRQKIEAEALEIFGPQSTPQQRAGRIMIASQVAEQSLDFDFDLMASDLAPIDLIIQRAGRLWRHVRPVRPLPEARLLIISPEPVADATANWFRDPLPKGSYVYENHALLWQSAKSLFDAGAIESPAGVRALVESVYGAGALEEAPKGLQGRRRIADGKVMADKSTAKLNLLELRNGYCADAGAWDSDILTPTRLGEERLILRLARWDGESLSPWHLADGEDFLAQRRAWALSEVAINRYRASGRGAYESAIECAAVKLEKPWREYGERAVILPLLESGGGLLGLLRRENGALIKVVYDARRGMML